MNHKPFSRIDGILSGNASRLLTDGCLVLEGGAFRGLYGEGVLDFWMQNDLNFRCVIGVSAGALNGLNYVSGQIGRSARANLNYRHDSRYVGGRALKQSHSLINLDFLLHDYNRIEPLDEDRFYWPEQRFVAVVTDCNTGLPLYAEKGVCGDILTAVKASASMPYISPMVEVDGIPCLDGGCSCKIAYQWALDQGFEKIVVVRTRERSFRKTVSSSPSGLPFKIYRHYPQFARAFAQSDAEYNRECEDLLKLEQSGRIFMIAPSQPVTVSRIERDLEKLGALYELGVRDAAEQLDRLKEYLR